jgi:hypothetical protein
VRIPAAPTLWLQGLHRGYKYGILMVAAWTPVAFPRHPFIMAVVLVMATSLFFLATPSERTPAGGATASGEKADAYP